MDSHESDRLPRYSERVLTTTRRRATTATLVCALVATLVACRPAPPVGAPPVPGTPVASPTATATPAATPAPSEPAPTTEAPAATPTPTAPAPVATPTPGDATPRPTPSPTSAAPAVTLPASGARFEYQLGGPDTPADGTEVVIRDSTAPPSGLYDVCYVNGFQTQPGDTERLIRDEPELVLHHDGAPLRDDGWPDEVLYDIRTPALRERVAERVGASIAACAAAGFDAVEVDNLDSYTRSLGLIAPEDALGLTELLVRRAHGLGLAYAQKNTAELTAEVRALGADLVVAEECRQWDECDVYTSAYPVVLDVEYRRDAFTTACAEQADAATRDPHLSVILRDRDVLQRGKPGAVHETC